MTATLIEKVLNHPKAPKGASLAVEHIVRAGKSVRVSRDRSNRRKLISAVPKKPELVGAMNPSSGFGWLPKGTFKYEPAAIEFAQKALEERRNIPRPRKNGKATAEEYLVHLSEPTRYEEAPPLFDLALSDECVQIATEYLGEVPVLLRLWILWSPVNSRMKGSQYYHRDGRQFLQKRVKFIFAANDVDDGSGPFTFLPGDLSERISDSFSQFKMHDRVEDDDIFRFAKREDELKFVGPAGSGLVIDTSRCFHFGSRTRGHERLLIMFQYWSTLDLPPGRGVDLRRSPAFNAKYGDDPIRNLIIPDDDMAGGALAIETD